MKAKNISVKAPTHQSPVNLSLSASPCSLAVAPLLTAYGAVDSVSRQGQKTTICSRRPPNKLSSESLQTRQNPTPIRLSSCRREREGSSPLPLSLLHSPLPSPTGHVLHADGRPTFTTDPLQLPRCRPSPVIPVSAKVGDRGDRACSRTAQSAARALGRSPYVTWFDLQRSERCSRVTRELWGCTSAVPLQQGGRAVGLGIEVIE